MMQSQHSGGNDPRLSNSATPDSSKNSISMQQHFSSSMMERLFEGNKDKVQKMGVDATNGDLKRRTDFLNYNKPPQDVTRSRLLDKPNSSVPSSSSVCQWGYQYKCNSNDREGNKGFVSQGSHSQQQGSLKTKILKYLSKGKAYLKRPAICSFAVITMHIISHVAGSVVIVLVGVFVLLYYLVSRLQIAIRKFLVKHLYPSFIMIDAKDSDTICPNDATNTQLLTLVVWVDNGDTNSQVEWVRMKCALESQLRTNPRLTNLQHSLTTRLGLPCWETKTTHQQFFKLEDHLQLGPKKFHNFRLTDEPSRELGGFSPLQKYVSETVSSFPCGDNLLWSITMVPTLAQSSLVILRFHPFLLKERDYILSHVICHGKEIERSLSAGDNDCNNNNDVPSKSEDKPEIQVRSLKVSPVINAVLFLLQLLHQVTSKSRVIWSWTFVFCRDRFSHLKIILSHSVRVIWAISYVPVQIYLLRRKTDDSCSNACKKSFKNSSVHSSSLPYNSKYKLYRNDSRNEFGDGDGDTKNAVRMSWTNPIPMELLTTISSKLGSMESTGFQNQASSILLTALSMALHDYYKENGIENPRLVGVQLDTNRNPVHTRVLVPSKCLYDIKGNLKKLVSQIESLDCTQLSLHFASMLPKLLPSWLGKRISLNFHHHYPIHVSLFLDDVNSSLTQSKILSKFSLKQPSQSCMVVSMIQETASNPQGEGRSFRVYVASYIKSVDTFISQRFPQYLNHIAEQVGVERHLIPYHPRRLSPPLQIRHKSKREPISCHVLED